VFTVYSLIFEPSASEVIRHTCAIQIRLLLLYYYLSRKKNKI